MANKGKVSFKVFSNVLSGLQNGDVALNTSDKTLNVQMDDKTYTFESGQHVKEQGKTAVLLSTKANDNSVAGFNYDGEKINFGSSVNSGKEVSIDLSKNGTVLVDSDIEPFVWDVRDLEEVDTDSSIWNFGDISYEHNITYCYSPFYDVNFTFNDLKQMVLNGRQVYIKDSDNYYLLDSIIDDTLQGGNKFVNWASVSSDLIAIYNVNDLGAEINAFDFYHVFAVLQRALAEQIASSVGVTLNIPDSVEATDYIVIDFNNKEYITPYVLIHELQRNSEKTVVLAEYDGTNVTYDRLYIKKWVSGSDKFYDYPILTNISDDELVTVELTNNYQIKTVTVDKITKDNSLMWENI